jgi:hypothetical protein
MNRSFTLSAKHYASKWQASELDDRNKLADVNKIAYEFATTTDQARKDELQLQLLECFHTYILKYLNMIIFGQLPSMKTPQGKDSKVFLHLLLSGTSYNPNSLKDLRDRCKTLHLAFKDQPTTDEVYDTLAFIFLKVCAHYDPLYPKKTEKVCNYIESQPAGKLITVDDISTAVDFDSINCLRILVSGKYIKSVSGPKKKVIGYKRGEKWPVHPKYFQVGSMGFVGFAQKFFRWYLRNYIKDKMKELESTKGVLQLDYLIANNNSSLADANDESIELGLPHVNGEWVDSHGIKWAADVDLLDHWKTFDLSIMDDAWVQETNDFLFKKLDREERYILQLVFAKEASWADIGKTLQRDSETVRNKFQQIMIYLKGRSSIKNTVDLP